MKYGCIGEHLKHSFSKEIHNLIDSYDYQIVEIEKRNLNEFMTKKDFLGINVTIPYKEKVMDYLDFISEEAKEIGSVNTIVNKNGELFGYNTDYFGLKNLVKKAKIDIKNKTVAILGTGGTCKTAKLVAKNLGAKKIYIVSRTKKENTITYFELQNICKEIEIIINTTPVGMFPNIENSPMETTNFSNLKGVVDVVYNPLKTKLILDAEKINVDCVNGLYMLVSQAVKASAIFFDKEIDDNVCEEIYNKILRQKQNIVLIGMPGVGKTTIAKLLKDDLKREFIDTDVLIEQQEKMPIKDIILEKGEKYFREIESKVIKEISSKSGVIIATGGGVVLNEENINALKMNGKIFFVDREIDLIIPTNDRPLTSNKEQLKKIYNERYSLYTKYADVIVKNPQTPSIANEQIKGEFLKWKFTFWMDQI